MAFKDKLLLKIDPKRLIERSDFFDGEWYKEKYNITGDPAKHYLEKGGFENCDPSDRFSSKDYLINNPDVKEINPLLHYEVFGKYEGRRAFIPKNRSVNDYQLEDIELEIEEYKKTIDEKKVVSFDVFDTLVIRPFLKAEQLFDVIESECELPGFAIARREAEEDARKKLNKEVNIDEIYDHIEEKFKPIREKEIEKEIAFCHFNPVLRPLYEYARKEGKRLIAVSDMYLGKDIIARILKNAGYEMDEIYVSCDLNLTKGSGKLYAYVFEKEEISASELVHFGDNYISDYSEAISNGAFAYQTPKISDLVLHKKENEALLSFMKHHDSLASSIYLAQTSEYLSASQKIPFFEKLAYILGGPLAYAYLSHICKAAKENGIDELLFVSRDGYCLKKIYDRYFFEKYQIASAYAYLSRACIISGSYENKVYNDPMKLSKVFKVYNNTQTDDAKALEAWSEKQSGYLRDHLEHISLGHERCASVDMFSGNCTSQKGANYYLKDKMAMGFYAGNFADSDIKHDRFCKRLLGMRDNLPVKISEFLITSYESPIMGVDRNGDPVYEYGLSEAKKERYEQIMKGIFAYIEDHRRFFEENEKYLFDPEEWFDLCEDYLRYCCQSDIDELALIIDSQGPVSSNNDKSIADLILAYRERGY
ncbi:MAG: hypothetical protein IJI46_04895 [Erysipelotrichaceae bacterium]|nr:hypothetical protein [Erysipelotrichaceae bacterium]